MLAAQAVNPKHPQLQEPIEPPLSDRFIKTVFGYKELPPQARAGEQQPEEQEKQPNNEQQEDQKE